MATRKVFPAIMHGKPDLEGLCCYCGMPSEESDHVYNKSNYSKPSEGMRSWWTGPLVESCGSCNRMLGGKNYPDPRMRAAYIAHRLRIKYAEMHSAPRWSPKEVAELGPGLRGYIKSWHDQQTILDSRIRWAKTVASIAWRSTEAKVQAMLDHSEDQD